MTYTRNYNKFGQPVESRNLCGNSLTANQFTAIKRERPAKWLMVIFIALSFHLLCANAQAQWGPQTSGTANNLRSVHFINANEGWAVGLSGTVLHTTNGGTLWVSLSGLTDNLLAVRFIDSSIGWTSSGTMIHRSTDGGSSWVMNVVHGGDFRNTIFAVSSTQAWSPVSGTGVRYFTRYTVQGSSIVPEDFNVISSAASPLDIYFIDSDNGWSVGTSGTITRISNASSASPSFSFQTSGTPQTLNAVHMVDANNGWIAGNNGTILHTTNGGANWSPQTNGVPATNFFDIFFQSDLLHGWAVGAGGAVIATINGGTTWFTESSGVAQDLRSVFFISGVGYAVGSAGTIIKRTGPTEIDLASFAARAFDNGVLLEWQTGYEVNNLGFNIYRDVYGRRARITSQLLAGSALVAGVGTSMTAGRSYAWADLSPGDIRGAKYWLEEIDLNGKSRLHGPVSIEFSAPGRPPGLSSQAQATTLARVGQQQALFANGLGSAPVERKAQSINLNPGQVALHTSLAAQPAVKIYIKQEGWYRITQQELLRAGLDTKTDPRNLQLYAEGIEQPISVSGEKDGRFDSEDAVGFYAIGMDNASTNTRVYWLVAGAQPGRRIPQAQGDGAALASTGFAYAVERKDRTIYFSSLRNGQKENFFGPVISREAIDQSLFVDHLDRSSTVEHALEVMLQGVTMLPHKVMVQLNGVDVGEVNFRDQAQGAARLPIKQSLIREGENVVRLFARGEESDISLLDAIRLIYQHSFAADGNALRLTVPGNRQVSVGGFTSGAIRVLDVTNPGAVQELTAGVRQQNTGYAVTFAAPAPGERVVYAFSDNQAKRPFSITKNQPSNWSQAGAGVDLLVITNRDFVGSVEPLVALRRKQGLTVAVVDVEDVYDEFSYGEKSSEALRNFLAFAKSNWTKSPRFALLVGDASFDPKNYLGQGSYDFVPTRLLDTRLMETASDEWLTDFNQDGIAEIAIGRLPARTPQEAAAMIGKIVDYERDGPLNSLLLVADSNDVFDFESATALLKGLVPADVKVEEIDRGRTDAATAKARLLEAINRGQKIVNYTGHGSVDQWRGNLLTSADVSSLANRERLPFLITMTCLNGYFQDAALDSLAESLMKSERGGAVAVWASTGMTEPTAQAVMNQEVFKSLFGKRNAAAQTLTLGEAITKAKYSISDTDIRRTWILFGDPSMRLK